MATPHTILQGNGCNMVFLFLEGGVLMSRIEIMYYALLKIGHIIFQGLGVFLLIYLALILKEIKRHISLKKKINNVIYLDEYKKSNLHNASR